MKERKKANIWKGLFRLRKGHSLRLYTQRMEAKFIKRVAELISIKRNEEYKDVINYLRTRLRFSILRSTLIAVRGVRGRKYERDNVSDVLFNLAQTPEE